MTPTTKGQIAVALSSAFVIAIGVMFYDWPAFTVLALFWLENVVIGVFTLLRILGAGARAHRYGESLFVACFFTVHYGLFCLVHGALLAALFGGIHIGSGSVGDLVLLMIGRVLADAIGVLVLLAMIVAAAGETMRWWAALDVVDDDVVKSAMFEPYPRIVVLHLVLIGGGFLMQMLDAPALAALLLVALKAAADIRRLRRIDATERAAALRSQGSWRWKD